MIAFQQRRKGKCMNSLPKASETLANHENLPSILFPNPCSRMAVSPPLPSRVSYAVKPNPTAKYAHSNKTLSHLITLVLLALPLPTANTVSPSPMPNPINPPSAPPSHILTPSALLLRPHHPHQHKRVAAAFSKPHSTPHLHLHLQSSLRPSLRTASNDNIRASIRCLRSNRNETSASQ